jgi:hypothetical protein
VKVCVSGAGREVTIEADDKNSFRTVLKAALETWKETAGAPTGPEGPAFGLHTSAAADRGPSSSMRMHPGVVE